MYFGVAFIGALMALLLWLALRGPGQDRNYP